MPKTYKCKCGKTGVKLWRDYQPFHGVVLLCVDCTCAVEGKDPTQVDEDGLYPSCIPEIAHLRKTDQIGWHIPAVPTGAEHEAYYGYTSVPEEAFEWWTSLPLK